MRFSNKLIKIIPDPCNGKEHYQSFIIKENKKSAKQSEIITYQPKSFRNQLLQNIQKLYMDYPRL